MEMIINGKSYMALLDPGSELSLIGPRVAAAVKDRLPPVEGLVKYAN